MNAIARYKPSLLLSLALGVTLLLYSSNHLRGLAYPAHDNDHVGGGGRSVSDILTAVPAGHGELLWGDYDQRLQLGTSAHRLVVSRTHVIDSTTGQMMVDPIGGSLNPSLLRLPRGSSWRYLGAFWGPARHKVRLGAPSREPTIALAGFNVTKDRGVVIVSVPQTLDIQVTAEPECFQSRPGSPFGLEDPRLFWTDAGTPAINFGRFADERSGLCWSQGIALDLREFFEPARDAILAGGPVRPYGREGFDGKHRELIRSAGNQFREKNWMAIRPGALPNKTAIVPHFGYMISPAVALRPTGMDDTRIYYDDVSPPVELQRCAFLAHGGASESKYHQATPFYRLTLCARGGCTPTIHNTVLFTLVHIQMPPRWAKFIAVYNVTEPLEPISVGPIFEITGKPEVTVNYVLSMSPLERSDYDDSAPPHIRSHSAVMPDHFFFDDEAILSFGHGDQEMYTTVIPIPQLLARQRMCSAVVQH